MYFCPQCSSELPPTPYLADPAKRFDGHFDCARCGLLSLMPMQTPEQIAALYAHTGSWQLLTPAEASVTSRRRLERLRVNLGTGAPGSLFEVGAARGDFLATAQAMGWTVDGIEPAESGRRQAFDRFGLRLREGMFQADAPGEGQFDALCAWDVLEHCLEPDRVLNAMLSWVRPGGVVVVAVPNVDGVPAQLLRSQWRYRMSPVHVHHFRTEWFQQFARSTGAEVVDMQFFAKAHAWFDSALPQSMRTAFRNRIFINKGNANPSQGPSPTAPTTSGKLRSALRGAVLRLNQTPVPLPLGDLVEVTVRRT